jgi:hypothetical protein
MFLARSGTYRHKFTETDFWIHIRLYLATICLYLGPNKCTYAFWGCSCMPVFACICSSGSAAARPLRKLQCDRCCTFAALPLLHRLAAWAEHMLAGRQLYSNKPEASSTRQRWYSGSQQVLVRVEVLSSWRCWLPVVYEVVTTPWVFLAATQQRKRL